MKKKDKVVIVITFAMIICLIAPCIAQDRDILVEYSDVSTNEWYADAIRSAVTNGLISGYENGKLKPNDNITRAQVATIFSNAFGAKELTSIDEFIDVDEGEWFYDAMSKAVKMGLFIGDDLGKLNPESPITREEVAIVICKAFNLEAFEGDALTYFVDKDKVSPWALSFVSALADNGCLSGNEKKEINPQKNISRAEFVQIMSNISNSYISKEGVISRNYEENIIVNVPNVIFKNMDVNGDVIIADGVGMGIFTLDNTKIRGNLLVRCGDNDSIKIINDSTILGKIIFLNHSGIIKDNTEESQ